MADSASVSWPETVQVGPVRWTVTTTRGTEDLGQTYEDAALIVLSGTSAEDVRRETLMHELLHAIHYTQGLAEDDRVKVHDVVKALSPLLLDTLRRNPDLVAYLAGEEVNTQ